MSLRLDGKVASLSIKQQLKEEFLKLDKKACLAIIHYPDGANASYLKGRMKIAEELNVDIKVYEINENDTTSSILNVIETLNNNKDNGLPTLILLPITNTSLPVKSML